MAKTDNNDTIMLARGIANVSGVSCHLTSALQVLFHAMPHVRTCLMALAEHDHHHNNESLSFLKQIGCLFRNLSSSSSCRDAADPTGLYSALSRLVSIDPNELGDAVTALRILLETMRQCVQHQVKQQQHGVHFWTFLSDLLNECVFCGQVNQTLTGFCKARDNLVQVRTKTKSRCMSCPVVIGSMNGDKEAHSIQEALFQSTMEPQIMEGYEWEKATTYTSETKTVEQVNNEYPNVVKHESQLWTTEKRTPLVSLPQHVFIHLQQRFSYENDKVTVIAKETDVPSTLDMADYSSPPTTDQACCFQYRLVGAILHVSEANCKEEEEDGHYISLVQQQETNHDGKVWIFLDDERVTMVDSPHLEVLNLLSCRQSTLLEEDNETKVATLLVYSRSCRCNEKKIHDLTMQFKEALESHQFQVSAEQSSTIHDAWQDDNPMNVVGKRLLVKWAKGKYYPGIVASYDSETGKHCVRYDDGDARHYILRKKTIQWQE